MLPTSTLLLLAASLVSGAVIPGDIFNRDSADSGTLLLDFTVDRTSKVPENHSLAKRSADGTLPVAAQNFQNVLYRSTVTVGTPPQPVEVILDTGSSDFFVVSTANNYCDTSAYGCLTPGKFDSSASSTYKKNNSDFFITYGDGSFQKGDWSLDTLTIGGAPIKDFEFAVGITGNASANVLGIGYPGTEATLYSPTASTNYTYSNLPIRLADSKIINTPAYSLWLNQAKDGATGSFLFGGVDHAKYEGTLGKVPIVKGANDFYTFLAAPLTQLTVSNNGSDHDVLHETVPALLDSGTSYTYLPVDIAKDVLTQLNATVFQQFGGPSIYQAACDLKGSLKYSFAGIEIDVPFENILVPLTILGFIPLQLPDGRNACQVTIQGTNNKLAILGDNFLRSAYVVYDLHNNEIALAKAKYDAADSNVEPIVSTIPSATLAPLYSSAANVAPVPTTISAEAPIAKPTSVTLTATPTASSI